MVVVDASCLYTVVTGAVGSEQIRERLSSELDQCAPHVVDVEVMNVVRRDLFLGRLDATLLTCDPRLARVPGLPCRAEVPVGGA